MVVNLTKQDIYLLSLCDIFCTVQTFKWGDFIFPLRNQLVICQSIDNLFSTNLIVDIDS